MGLPASMAPYVWSCFPERAGLLNRSIPPYLVPFLVCICYYRYVTDIVAGADTDSAPQSDGLRLAAALIAALQDYHQIPILSPAFPSNQAHRLNQAMDQQRRMVPPP